MTRSKCVGCGALFSDITGTAHRYLESSPGCWATYCEVLVREYTDTSYGAVHCLTVDAYALQHPGRPSPQTIQSAVLHLIRLSLILGEGYDPARATAGMRVATRSKRDFRWLTPPANRGLITVHDVHAATSAAQHIDLVHNWAESTFGAWQEHHHIIRELLGNIGITTGR